jgi:peptidylprolyl isomerase
VAAVLFLSMVVSGAAATATDRREGGGQGRADGVYAEIRTNKGLIVARLEAERTPMAVANFVGLAEGTIANEAFDSGTPYYDGSVFHRVVPGHVIQAGTPDPSRSDAQGPGYTFPNEIHADLSHDHAGALGMANSAPHTNSAQFYITLGDRSYLDGDYIVFGEVVEGMDVVLSIVKDDVIESIGIVRIGADAETFRPDTATFEALVAAAEARVESGLRDRRRLEREYMALRFPGPRVTWLEGVRHVIRRAGEGPRLTEGDTVSIRYVGIALRYLGHMIGGEGPLFEEIQFGGSAQDGSPEWVESPDTVAAFEYEVGATDVNPPFDRAVREMRRGSRHIVILPLPGAYPSGYYAPERPGEKRLVIPPLSTVFYAIEILDR